MNKNDILARHEELLTERGIMLNEILNATEGRKIEIYAWFDSMREELRELMKQMRDLT